MKVIRKLKIKQHINQIYKKLHKKSNNNLVINYITMPRFHRILLHAIYIYHKNMKNYKYKMITNDGVNFLTPKSNQSIKSLDN